ncbi:hypothetical protein TDB9533_03162 [Thalassocella blandensis]|nr:hypothetical protein TDB9533_03162 [Thalassocella blandensis]
MVFIYSLILSFHKTCIPRLLIMAVLGKKVKIPFYILLFLSLNSVACTVPLEEQHVSNL